MLKRTMLLTILLATLMLLNGGTVVAAPPTPHLNWGNELNSSQCPDGELVISVVHQVVNDADSGLTRYWAFDSYTRQIQVWQVGTDTFCALVQYEGAFVTTAGSSPQNTDTDGIAAGIMGTMQGGYRGTFTGTLNPAPAYPTQGNIGTFDYDCNSSGSCNAPFSWRGTYFNPTSEFVYDWWGWIYRAGTNGTWVNASTGNSGDITD